MNSVYFLYKFVENGLEGEISEKEKYKIIVKIPTMEIKHYFNMNFIFLDIISY